MTQDTNRQKILVYLKEKKKFDSIINGRRFCLQAGGAIY